ncbi:MAG: 23S rRNA (adenine(2503)-C(2))-methyltransferase RlmN [Oscillospiraceae bacterium]|nr:23S rRNA (adenine(2503)-C(2))-methyltransferase RlmN [Oscillospiraceae bacterium]
MLITDILSLTLDELTQVLLNMGEKKFRALQIYEWLHKKRATSFDDMTNLSSALRKKLAQECFIGSLKVVRKLESQSDNTVKFLYELSDGNHVETVLMQYEHGDSLCVSTQVGCKMGCRFCASTIAGFKRSLEPSEILLQLYEAERSTGRKVSSIVLMGIGEPLDNYDNVIKFLNILSSENGTNMSLRHVSLSTCGLVDRIYDLAKLDLGLTLSISLHATNDVKRSELMPINNRYNISELMKACYDYFSATGRRISFEYALIDGENDSLEDAKALASLVKRMPSHINIIPVNKIKERSFTSNRRSAQRFCKMLCDLGVNATVRRTLGADIDAACGQLRREYEI